MVSSPSPGARRANVAAAKGPCSAISAASASGVRRTLRGQGRANKREVDGLSRGVDDEPQRAVRAGRAGHHQVVDDAAVVVEQLGIALAAGSETEDVGGAERFEKGRDGCMIGALDQRLAHVRDVEQPSRFAGVEVLGEDARRILDRHVVAGERRDARAELDVQGVERGLLVRGFVHGPAGREQAPAATPRRGIAALALADAPSVR